MMSSYFLDLRKLKKNRLQARKIVEKFYKKENISNDSAFPVELYFDKIFEQNKKYILDLTNDRNVVFVSHSKIDDTVKFSINKDYYKLIDDDYSFRSKISNFVASYYLLIDLHSLYMEYDEYEPEIDKLYWQQVELFKEELLLPYSKYDIKSDPNEICKKYKIELNMYLKLSKKKFSSKKSK